MAAQNVQFGLFTYTDDGGASWTVRCDKAWGANADSGLTAFADNQPRLEYRSKRYHPRYAIMTDRTTGRSTRRICGTTACDAWAEDGYTTSIPDPGLASAVTYTRSGRYGEHMPQDKSAPNFPEHT